MLLEWMPAVRHLRGYRFALRKCRLRAARSRCAPAKGESSLGFYPAVRVESTLRL
jgi:hypothetical protein